MLTLLAVATFFGDLAAKEATKSAFKRLTKSKLADHLTAELKEWAGELQEQFKGFEPTYLIDVTHRKKELGSSNQALAEELGHLLIPSEELWYQALEERREDAGELLLANPQALARAGGSDFYLAADEDVEDALYDAAHRLWLVCQRDPELTAAATYQATRRTEALVQKLIDAEAQAKLTPAPVAPSAGKPWALENFIQGAVTETVSGDATIAPGLWVVAVFQAKPSGAWKDPYATVEGTWDEKSQKIGVFAGEPRTGLCIPSYWVDVEWREATLVQDPLWGSVKRKVVSRFLKICQGKRMICRIVYVGQRRGHDTFHLYSADYDGYLVDQWTYFKGLESALSTNDLYKSYLSESELRRVIREKVMARVTQQNMANRFRPAFANRPADPEDVALVLRGLMERYRIYEKRRPIPRPGPGRDRRGPQRGHARR